MIRILIADRHPCTRAGYRNYLSTDCFSPQAGEASDPDDILGQLTTQSWDLLMLDMQFLVQSRLSLLKDARSASRTVRILITSGLSDAQWARPLMQAGVDGYISKSCSREEVVRTVRNVLDRRTAANDAVEPAHGHNAASPKPIGRLHDSLSLREFQILCQVATGRRLADTASQLGISVKTVSTYRMRLLEKMGFSRNAEITYYALRHGLIPFARLGD